MQNIKDFVKSISGVVETEVKPKKITFVIDESGSTGTAYAAGMTVLEKELSIAYEYILNNMHNSYNMYSFESSCVAHPIHIMKEEGLVNLPNLSPKGGTYTHLPFEKINTTQDKPDVIILITDGQTNSSEAVLKAEVNKFAKNNITFEIIAVSATNLNMNTISQAEEQRIPGMDLINYLSNLIDKLTIYNTFHKDVPYEGANSSKINKKCLTFMGCNVQGYVYQYINNLLEKLNEQKGNISWGTGNINLKQMLSEIGKLLSVYFVSFPKDHFYITLISQKLHEICNIQEMTPERITNIIKYGFECTKNEKPILYTNFEQHVKEGTVKKAEFADAIQTLKVDGTTMDSKKTICMPTNGLCVINNGLIQLTQSLGPYPNSKDGYGNVYFGCDDDLNGQATRIAYRELCGQLGYKDKMGPEPAFYVLNEMSLMFISGIDLSRDHMVELRKLAVVQTSMETIIAKNKYDGVGLWKQWKAGKMVPTHFTKQTQFHSQLYKDPKINPLRLEEPMWWALMMAMLGLFEEQRNMYDTALMAKGIVTEKDFLAYARDTYKDKVQGKIALYTTLDEPISVFTMDNFEPTDDVYILEKHGNCSTKTCYSKQEIELYVLQAGCVWCKYKPSWADFKSYDVNKTNQVDIINNLMASCSKLHVLSDDTHHDLQNNNKILINMVGITGAGKSTVSQKISDLVTSNGGSCLIVSADKWSKKGHKGKQLQNSINKEITDFDNKQLEQKVLIVDICNENGPTSIPFGFDTSEYTTFTFYPNLDKNKFDEYQCWCLRNVLSRQMHTETSLYWLNPESAGVSTCIKVHNMKTKALKTTLGINSSLTFNESMTKEQITNLINARATAYQTYLATKTLDEAVSEFVKSTGFKMLPEKPATQHSGAANVCTSTN